MILIRPNERGVDDFGSGAFGASRGRRTHRGIDYAVEPGQEVCPGVAGVVTKLGFPYADDLSWRYVEVTAKDGLKHRFFYVEPQVSLGEPVEEDTVIGVAQDIASHYNDGDRKMVNHVHYEVKTQQDRYINPETAS